MFSRCVLLEAWARLGRLHKTSACMRRQPREASYALLVFVTVLGLVGGTPGPGGARHIPDCLLVSYSPLAQAQRPR